MAWNVAVGTPTEGMKSLKDEGCEHLLALVSHELLPVPQDLGKSSGGDRASLKRQHQSMSTRHDEADDDDVVDDQAHPSEKKRRLTPQQLKFLETSFEVENKLGPERKEIIAHRLGLRPRQVAIWFQNRRARWKNKQLEQDYESLKSKYESAVKENEKAMKDNEAVMEENKRLQAEIVRIMALLQSSVDLHELGNGTLDLRKDSYEDQKKQQQQEVGSLLSAKSELASPTKSEDQSEVQDSGRSYPPTSREVIASETDQMVIMGDFNDAAMMICSYPVVKLEETALVTSEERLGNLFDPVLFHQLAASGVCLDDARCCLCRWEDQSPWLPWYQD